MNAIANDPSQMSGMLNAASAVDTFWRCPNNLPPLQRKAETNAITQALAKSPEPPIFKAFQTPDHQRSLCDHHPPQASGEQSAKQAGCHFPKPSHHFHDRRLHTLRSISKFFPGGCCSISTPTPVRTEPLQYAWGGFGLDPCASWVSSACLWWLTEQKAYPSLKTFCGWGILQLVTNSNIFPVQQILSTLESNFYWICNPLFSSFSPLLILPFKPFTRSSLSEGQQRTVDRDFGFKKEYAQNVNARETCITLTPFN